MCTFYIHLLLLFHFYLLLCSNLCVCVTSVCNMLIADESNPDDAEPSLDTLQLNLVCKNIRNWCI